MSKTSSPIKRYGGKSFMVKTLIDNLPTGCESYLEPYFGSGALFFAVKTKMPTAFKRFAINDLDSSLTTFFTELRDRPEQLIRNIELTPYSLDEFVKALKHSDDPTEEARRVWIRSRQSFSGKAASVGDWSRSFGSGEWRPQTSVNVAKELPVFAKSLMDVAIDNIDAVKFVDKWTKPNTFCYLDPPYLHETRQSTKDYKHEMSEEDHVKLLDLVVSRAQTTKFLISGYDSGLYAKKLSGFTVVPLHVSMHCAKERTGKTRTEILWKNY